MSAAAGKEHQRAADVLAVLARNHHAIRVSLTQVASGELASLQPVQLVGLAGPFLCQGHRLFLAAEGILLPPLPFC